MSVPPGACSLVSRSNTRSGARKSGEVSSLRGSYEDQNGISVCNTAITRKE